ncbi:MAG: bifunctional 4-hydroxy-3-methylbut-2-enyl diphosphate reductase/30S ribosomal protein S1 [Fusobacterium sp.]|nr:bifunctional 4-hydroxy-3-methylbut-2-enyl diphosphate reductase/30S ribosomal protein S1 [Fusobacterium sp.]
MEIIRAKHMGFCFGVLEAVNICDSLEKENRKKYILGMLVHNTHVMNEMKEKGFDIVTEEELLKEEDKLKEKDIVVIRAHGTSKKVYEKLQNRKVEIYDATCLFVSKIRKEIEFATREGYSILFVGDKNHPEVKGIISFAKDIQIFENLEEARKIEVKSDKKYLLSTQTTLNKKKFEEIKKYFKNIYKNVEIFDKICGATAVRQNAVEDLAKKVDLMIIVGDKKSSNTKKLYEISLKINENTILIEDELGLDLTLLKNKATVGITAGASTPEVIIKNIEKKIRGGHRMPNLNENHDEEFLAMLEDFQPNQDKRVEGVINMMDMNYTYLDVPGERTAVRVKTEELEGYNVGDTVEVIITGLQEYDNDQEFINASRKKIEIEKNWHKIEDSFNNKTVLEGTITRKIKGGYLVQALLYPGFLPNSLSEIPQNDEKTVGRKIPVIVKDIKMDPRDKRQKKITYSVKEIRLLNQEKEFAALEVDQVVDCKIVDVLDFGLAVAIGNLRGFIHISEISWKRLDKLSDIYKAGDEIKAVIVSLDEAKKNIKLSVKKLEKDPWTTIEDLKVGDELDVTVTKVLAYGAFVEVKPGVEGLVHISDFTWTKKRVNVSDFVKEGEKIKVRVIDLQIPERKLKLGIKQLVANPWEEAETKFAVGTVFKGKVVEVKNFGMFVQIEEGVDAFVHCSDYNWIGEEAVKFEIGQEVEVKITELDVAEKKMKASVKALRKSPWERAMDEFKEGITVERPIKTVADFGLFIELVKGIDGFIPTQFASKDFIKDIKERFKVGDVVKAQIVEVNKETQKIKLSIKKIEQEAEKREQEELINKYSVSGEEN